MDGWIDVMVDGKKKRRRQLSGRKAVYKAAGWVALSLST